MTVQSKNISIHKAKALLSRIRRQPFPFGTIIDCPVGSEWPDSTDVALGRITGDQLQHHMAVLGTTGAGKSKFLSHFARQLFEMAHGFTFIDPHGNTVEEIMEYIAFVSEQTGVDHSDRIEYIAPRADSLFSFDPFRYPLGDKDNEVAYEAWLETAASQLQKSLLRGYTSAEKGVMVRLTRWLTTFLKASGRVVGGARVSLADLDVLINTSHSRHHQVFNVLRDHLAPEELADFNLLHDIKREIDRNHFTESTSNRLREFFGVVVKLIFSDSAPSIDFAKIVRERKILLVNLENPDFISDETRSVVGGIILNEIVNEARRAFDANKAVRHFLIMDEAGYFIAEDFKNNLERVRKWKLSFCIAGQTPATFERGDENYFDDILNLCSTFISFQVKGERHAKEIGTYVARAARNHTERIEYRDRPGGHVPVQMIDRNEVVSHSTSRSASEAKSKSENHSFGVSASKSDMVSESEQASYGISATKNSTKSKSTSGAFVEGTGTTTNQGYVPMMVDGMIVMQPSMGSGSSVSGSRTFGDANVESEGQGEGVNASLASGSSTASGTGLATSVGIGIGESASIGSSFSESFSVAKGVSFKTTLVPITYEDAVATGRPQYDLMYQDDVFITRLSTAPTQHAFMRIKTTEGDKTFLFRAADVFSLFATAAEAMKVTATFRANLLASKDYIFTPTVRPDRKQNERIDAFLQQAKANKTSQGNVPDNPFGSD